MTIKIGTLVDQLARLHDKVTKQKEIVKREEMKLAEIKNKYYAKEEEIINHFPDEELTGAAGKLGAVSLDIKEIPTVSDWPKFYAYIIKNKATDLLQKRINTTAYRERAEAKEKVPGTKIFRKKTLKFKGV